MSPRCPRARSRWRSLDPGPKAGRCAIPEYSAISIRSVFQSSPGPKAGRCPSTLAWRRRHYRRFNPRPARRPGAAGRRKPFRRPHVLFQSSPGPKAGRCPCKPAEMRARALDSRRDRANCHARDPFASFNCGDPCPRIGPSCAGEPSWGVRQRFAQGLSTQKTSGARWSNGGRVPNVCRCRLSGSRRR